MLSRPIALVILACTLQLVACGTDETSATGAASDAGGDDAVATTDATGSGQDAATGDGTTGTPGGLPPATFLFDPNGIHEVQITLAPADWQDILTTAKVTSAVRNWHPGEVLIDGTAYTKVGLRVFGQGSMAQNPAKPNVRMKFDEFDGLLRGPNKRNNLRLKAGGTEPTFLRETLAFDGFAAVAGGGILHSFARVTVNGVYMGLYQLFEQPDNDTMSRVTGTKPTSAYEPNNICQGLNCVGDGCAALKASYDLKSGDFADATALVAALKNTPDASFVATVGKLIDLNNLIGVYAVEAAISEMDGLAASGMNYMLFNDPKTGLFHVLRSGADEVMSEGYAVMHPWGPPNGNCPERNDEVLARLLAIPETKAIYVAALKTLHCGVLSDANVLARVDQLKSMIGAELAKDPLAQAKGADFDESITELRKWLHTRNQTLEQVTGPCP